MSYRNCSTCAYSEMHDYAGTFYCRNEDCVMHICHDFREICGCENWESKHDFKWGKCSECRFSKHDEETNTFTCNSKDRRQIIRPVNEKEHKDCLFCSPKPKEVPKPKEPQQSAEETNLFTPQIQQRIRLYCVRHSVQDNGRSKRIEYLVNATSPEEAATLAKEFSDKISCSIERIIKRTDITPIPEKGVIDVSELKL